MVSAVAETGATSTFTGLVSIEFANLLISSGKVAEKKSVCLFGGNNLMIFFTSCTKPISSILSASSKTKTSKC